MQEHTGRKGGRITRREGGREKGEEEEGVGERGREIRERERRREKVNIIAQRYVR